MKAFYVENLEKAVQLAYTEKRDMGVFSFPWSDNPSDLTGQGFFSEIEILPNLICFHDEKGYHLAETVDDIIKYLEEKGLKALRKKEKNV